MFPGRDIRDVFGVDYLLNRDTPRPQPASNGRDIREIFGVDYLLTPPPQTPEIDPGIHGMIRMLKVLQAIQSSPGNIGTVLDLIGRSQMDGRQFLDTIGKMKDCGMIECTTSDMPGNHEIRMTDFGRQILEIGS
jgi:hypothetical protein